MDSAFSIIGGADGPTSVFLSSGGSLLLSGLIIVAAYFIGNISPAILISKTKGTDIRQTGSGNAGTTIPTTANASPKAIRNTSTPAASGCWVIQAVAACSQSVTIRGLSPRPWPGP